MSKSSSGKCLNPNCGRKPVCRGLCHPCYVAAHHLVKTGQTTWEKLEKTGRVKPTGKRGPKGIVSSWLLGE